MASGEAKEVATARGRRKLDREARAIRGFELDLDPLETGGRDLEDHAQALPILDAEVEEHVTTRWDAGELKARGGVGLGARLVAPGVGLQRTQRDHRAGQRATPELEDPETCTPEGKVHRGGARAAPNSTRRSIVGIHPGPRTEKL
jgi:hypothetical protein